MSWPEWVWKCPKALKQYDNMRKHDGYEMWIAGIPCAAATAYEAENRILEELLAAAAARGETLAHVDVRDGDIIINHQLSDGQVLLACVFTAPYIIDGVPILRGATCVQDEWHCYTNAARQWLKDDPDLGYVKKPIPHPPGWCYISTETELHIRNTSSRSEAMQQMEKYGRAYVTRFAAEQIEPHILAAKQKVAKKTVELDILAGWSSR